MRPCCRSINNRFYSERIVHLPDCYQPNDRRRQIADRTPARAEVGLPEHGFVFCSFNNSWKITPEVFDVWMRLLKAIDGSVFWLLRDRCGSGAELEERGGGAGRRSRASDICAAHEAA